MDLTTMWLRIAVALIGVLGVGAVGSGCGDATQPGGIAPVSSRAGDASTEPKSASLDFPRGGSPIVTVRRDARIGFFDAPDGELLERVGDTTEFGSRAVFSVSKRRGDWAAIRTAYFENGRLVWVRLDPERLRADSLHTAIEVDLSDFRATFLYKGRVVSSFPVSIGMPSAPTPTGEFAVTDTFRGGLDPAYGCCAVALTARQTRLPSGWLGGDRIAIHGTSGPLGAEISHGCVRSPDANVSELIDKVAPGTPVTVHE